MISLTIARIRNLSCVGPLADVMKLQRLLNSDTSAPLYHVIRRNSLSHSGSCILTSRLFNFYPGCPGCGAIREFIPLCGLNISLPSPHLHPSALWSSRIHESCG